MYSHSILLERTQLALLRGIASVLATYASVFIWHVLTQQSQPPFGTYFVPAILAALITVAATWKIPSDGTERASRRTFDVLKAVVLTALIMMALSFFLRTEAYSRGTLIVFIPTATLFLLIADRFDRRLSTWLRSGTSASRNVLLVGYGAQGQRMARSLIAKPGYYTVVGYLDDTEHENQTVPRLGSVGDLRTVLDEHDIEQTMIALSGATTRDLQELMGICMEKRVDWNVVPPLMDLVLDQVRFDYVGGLPVVRQRGSKLVGYNWYFKRAFDLVGASTLLILLSPLMALIYLMIKLTSRGPAIFKQTRIGLRERPFTVYKFRTMTVQNDVGVHQSAATDWVYGKELAGEEEEGPRFKLAADARITSAGKVLRATSLDELPQLWNVAKGDMSLVGPRPPIGYEVEQYTEWHKRRLEVPPGITGLWQVSGRNSLSFEEMVELDLDYIDSWSVALDLSILIRTIPAVVVDRGK